MKETFESLFNLRIKREGSQELLDYIRQSDFFEAPASTKFHSAFKGGLVHHSLNVYDQLGAFFDGKNNDDKRMESIAICGLLHDLCKTNYYKIEMRNVKNQLGVWVKVPYYTVDDQEPYGHGEKSVYIITQFMKLTPEEAYAIRWHMGGFDEAVAGGSQAISAAYYKYPLAVLLHMADMAATFIDEKLPNQE